MQRLALVLAILAPAVLVGGLAVVLASPLRVVPRGPPAPPFTLHTPAGEAWSSAAWWGRPHLRALRVPGDGLDPTLSALAERVAVPRLEVSRRSGHAPSLQGWVRLVGDEAEVDALAADGGAGAVVLVDGVGRIRRVYPPGIPAAEVAADVASVAREATAEGVERALWEGLHGFVCGG